MAAWGPPVLTFVPGTEGFYDGPVTSRTSPQAGTVAAVAAFLLWGLFPLYWKQLASVPALEVVAHRTAWGFVAMAAGSAVLIGLNWLLYVWAVVHDHVVEASLGYFINPLVNVLLGVLVLGERWPSSPGMCGAACASRGRPPGKPPRIARMSRRTPHEAGRGSGRSTSPIARGATVVLLALPAVVGAGAGEARPWVAVRAIYGGVPQEILDSGRGLREFGVDAVWLGSGSVTPERMALLRAQGVRAFAEFNTLHVAEYLKEHPEAAPVGSDGQVSPPPDGWQGICPSHEAYRKSRMDAFRQLLRDFDVDGVWLDYHHAHASWEQAEPNMPDTCFCERCLSRFQGETGTKLPEASAAERARLLLSTHRKTWVRWRCDLLTDWVREFREIRDETRPRALLGTFHNPWSDEDHGGARLEKLAIDLRAQAAHFDVFSPMPYHARFGHAADPEWISRQVAWLGRALGIEGRPGERHRIWPIVQISDWGETVPLEQVPAVLDHGSRRPATGVMVFAWGGLRKQPEKIEAIGRAFRALSPAPAGH